MVKEKVLHVTPRKLNEDSQNRTVWGINAVAVDERSIPETSVPQKTQNVITVSAEVTTV